jgi:hypothetical protein
VVSSSKMILRRNVGVGSVWCPHNAIGDATNAEDDISRHGIVGNIHKFIEVIKSERRPCSLVNPIEIHFLFCDNRTTTRGTDDH